MPMVYSVEWDNNPAAIADHTTSTSTDDTLSAIVLLPIAFKIQSPIPKLDRFGLLSLIEDLLQP